MAILTVLAGCDAAVPVADPPPPPGFTRPANYPLGDRAAAAEQRALAAALDALSPRWNRPVRVAWLAAERPLEGALVRAHYRAALGSGWIETTIPLGIGTTLALFEKEGRGLAVVMPPPRSDAPAVITVLALERRRP